MGLTGTAATDIGDIDSLEQMLLASLARVQTGQSVVAVLNDELANGKRKGKGRVAPPKDGDQPVIQVSPDTIIQAAETQGVRRTRRRVSRYARR